MKSFARFAVLFLALAAGGCVPGGYPPPPADILAQIENVGVVPAPHREPEELEIPVTGRAREALKGAGKGALKSVVGGTYGGAMTGSPHGFVLGIALGIAAAPVVAVFTGLTGAIETEPEPEAVVARNALAVVFSAARANESLRDEIVQNARRLENMRLVARPAADFGDSYRGLAGAGLDTVLEIEMTGIEPDVSGSFYPDMRLVFSARARFMRTRDDAELYRREWTYVTPKDGFYDWAENDARKLRVEMAAAYRKFAEKITADLFVTRAREKRGLELPPVGAVYTTLVHGPGDGPPPPILRPRPRPEEGGDAAAKPGTAPAVAAPHRPSPPCRDVGGYEAFMARTGKVCRLD